MKDNKVFLDTNILVYAFDVSAEQKHTVAQNILKELWNNNKGCISTQVLQEFFVTVTKKIPKPLKPLFAKEIINDLLKWDIVINDGNLILEAINIFIKNNFSFWDSMIIQAAIQTNAAVLLSEDLPHNRTIGNLTIHNPFMTDYHTTKHD